MPIDPSILKMTLAGLLPEQITAWTDNENYVVLLWKNQPGRDGTKSLVLDTELLEICRRIELGLPGPQREEYRRRLQGILSRTIPKPHMITDLAVAHAAWEERAEALGMVCNRHPQMGWDPATETYRFPDGMVTKLGKVIGNAAP